jgi:AcrR family transcriptional regulator
MSETKESILVRATELFLRRSYEGVSIQDIAQAVGLTKSSLYHHFPKGKEQIFQEVADGIFAKFIFDYAERSQLLLGELCRAFLDNQRQVLASRLPLSDDARENEKGKINFYGLLWDAFRTLPDFRGRIETHTSRERSVWREAAQRSIEKKEIRADLDPERVARLFTATLDGAGMAIIWKGRDTYLEDVEELWGDLLVALAPRKKGGAG